MMAPSIRCQLRQTPTLKPVTVQASTNESATTEDSAPNATTDAETASVTNSETIEWLNGNPYSELDNDQAIKAELQCKWKFLCQLERKLELQEIQH